MIAGEQLSLGFVQQLCVRLMEAILKHDHECSTGRQNSTSFGLTYGMKQCRVNLNFTSIIR